MFRTSLIIVVAVLTMNLHVFAKAPEDINISDMFEANLVSITAADIKSYTKDEILEFINKCCVNTISKTLKLDINWNGKVIYVSDVYGYIVDFSDNDKKATITLVHNEDKSKLEMIEIDIEEQIITKVYTSIK